MKLHGQFTSRRWGTALVLLGNYGAKGPLAVVLQSEDGEPLATLSVHMYPPEASHLSRDLPEGAFYVQYWNLTEDLREDALLSGLFKARPDLPDSECSFVRAPAWQLAYPDANPAHSQGEAQ